MTYAVFVKYIDYCDVVHAILHGTLTESQRRRLDLDRVQRQLLLQERFTFFFEPLNFED